MKDIMQQYETLFRDKQNPLYAWYALMASLDCELDPDTKELVYVGPDCGIPTFVMSYLATVASRLIALTRAGKKVEEVEVALSPNEKTDRVAAALDLVSPGRNAFKNYRVDQTDAVFTIKYDRLETDADKRGFLAKARPVRSAPAHYKRMRKTRKSWAAQDARGRKARSKAAKK